METLGDAQSVGRMTIADWLYWGWVAAARRCKMEWDAIDNATQEEQVDILKGGK
jgi:predicted solute-binding protein